MTPYRFTLILWACVCFLSCSDDKTTSARTPAPPAEVAERPIAGLPLEELPVADVPLTNVASLSERFGLSTYHRQNYRGQNLTIAVLDNGFTGVEVAKGKRLPLDVEVPKAPGNPMQDTTHGTKMAEIVYAMATGSSQYVAGRPGPKMVLLNTNGFTNFKWAIDEVRKRNVDIVLYAQVWEYGGNGDGSGFINAEVQKAINAGVLWVNAAGNMGLATYSAPIHINEYLKVQLPYLEQYIRFNVPQDDTPTKIVLAWNDFTDSPEHKTKQDLDLVLESHTGEVISQANLLQQGRGQEGDPRYSAHAREIISQTLARGRYRLRVVAKSTNFDAASRLRITIDGMGVTMLDRSEHSSVLMPADHRDVLAVGANDTATSGESQDPWYGVKPEIKVPSEIVFADGSRFQGTSAASALATGAIAAYASASGSISRAELLASPFLAPWINRGSGR